MKKLLFSMLFLAATNFVSAQSFDFGIKAGMVYNADKGAIKSFTNAVDAKGKGSAGFQAGVLSRISLIGFYVQPEVLYTSFKNEFDDANGQSFKVTKQRIDIPVNIGKKFLGIAHAQVGPVFSYYLDDKNSLKDIVNAKQDQFNVGFQIGAGVEISKLLINARYEFGLGKVGSTFMDKNNIEYQVENRPNLLNVSLTYLF
ncbi:porin family protein [Myroides ceti]|uniref:Porin family protein n=1 Tax=Paenimyroides ceti TaxID=395087 RepID=A0ABT8CZG8_9FLAO|nr:porin family protein [Paenimyroides ceti]MDN3705923.1 porin family protein [Paenimyroides ceti]MDN3709511.1 porin family protein [Paenimyroides ceti]